MFEDKYSKPTISYFASVFVRKIESALLSYPEFLFLFKILGAAGVISIVFYIFYKIITG